MAEPKLNEGEDLYYETLSSAEQQMVDAFYNLKKGKQLAILKSAFKFMMKKGQEDEARRVFALHKRIAETNNGFDFSLEDDVRTLLMAKELVASLMVPIALKGDKMSRGHSRVTVLTPSGHGSK